MRNILTLARKEVAVSFTTVWAWVVFAAMAFVSSVAFILALTDFKQIHEMARSVGWQHPEMRSYEAMKNLTDGVISPMWGIMLFVSLVGVPVLSMRLMAEERKQKTLELLMTSPITPLQIVLGKYLGGLFTVVSMFSVTLLYPVILSLYGASESGQALEWSTVLLGYLALLLWGAAAMGIGLFISTLTESQVLAGFLTLVVLITWILISPVARTLDEPLRSIVSYISVDAQMANLFKGVLDLKTLVFFGSVVVFSLFLTHRAVEAQRWA